MTPLRIPSLLLVRVARSPLAKAIVAPVSTATDTPIRIVFISPLFLRRPSPPPVLPKGNTSRQRISSSALGANRARDLSREAGGLGRRRADADAVRFERLFLALRGAGRSGDERPGVPHRLAGWGRGAGDVAHDRLRHLGADELGCLLFLVAADLADQHDELGLVVFLEPREHVDERRADDRIAADADDRRVPEPELGQLVANLI